MSITNDPLNADNAYYDPAARSIALGPKLAGDPDVVLREYTHHVLSTGRDDEWWTDAMGGLESGLADYLPCSFKGDPVFGAHIAPLFDLGPWIRNMSNTLTWSDVPADGPVQQFGEVWGGALWDLRQLLGADAVDRALIQLWQRLPPTLEDGLVPWFVEAFVDMIPRDDVREIFDKRELPPEFEHDSDA